MATNDSTPTQTWSRAQLDERDHHVSTVHADGIRTVAKALGVTVKVLSFNREVDAPLITRAWGTRCYFEAPLKTGTKDARRIGIAGTLAVMLDDGHDLDEIFDYLHDELSESERGLSDGYSEKDVQRVVELLGGGEDE